VTTWTKKEWGGIREDPSMAMGWEKGVVPALCTVLCPPQVRGGLDKTWLCPLSHPAGCGAAASPSFTQGWGKSQFPC